MSLSILWIVTFYKFNVLECQRQWLEPILIDVFSIQQSLYLYCLGSWRRWFFRCFSCWWEFVRIWKGKCQSSREKLILWFIYDDLSYDELSRFLPFSFLFQNKDGAGDSSFPVVKDQTQFSVAHARYSKVMNLMSFWFLDNLLIFYFYFIFFFPLAYLF